jgi:hypothetical protein
VHVFNVQKQPEAVVHPVTYHLMRPVVKNTLWNLSIAH